MGELSTNGDGTAPKRKLIEVALPLEAINRESAREKSIRHGHPSALHLWWARRPLAAARAVLFAQLVDDPSSHPDKFPTEEAQRAERERLHKLIERLVVWENTRDEELLDQVHREILDSTDGNPPPILDPFAGGGTIPLEAQRLGLEAHASDLNPVAVLINKALVEIPPKFRGRPPVFPGLAAERMIWEGASGLAADVRAYGEWMCDEAFKRIGHHYPKAVLPDGSDSTVIAWIWARTVTCPNPACGIEMPLVRSWWLGKKKGKEAWVRPVVVPDHSHPSRRRVEFEVAHGGGGPTATADGTVGRSGATCIACGSGVDLAYVRSEGRAGRIGTSLMAVVAEGVRARAYLSPTEAHRVAAAVPRPPDAPEAPLPLEALGFRVQNYGMTHWADLFTNRQLLALTTLSDLVAEARERVLRDGLGPGASAGGRLEDGGLGAEAYADALATYLSFCVSRTAGYQSALGVWSNHPKNELVVHLFGRPTLSMAWDFGESSPLSEFSASYRIIPNAIDMALPARPVRAATVQQADAALVPFDAVVSTDPPYYDNIGYSDLSDFFYVWLRRSLQDVYPGLLATMLVPKLEELVANPYRHDGKNGAQKFFEDGFRSVFARARTAAFDQYPITVYYAFKQSEGSDDGTASTGWETLLEGMMRSGWGITSTWPVRSERPGRMRDVGSNALASSIVLSLRPRSVDAPTTDRRGLIAALHDELPDALRKLQQGAIAPVDLPQAAIGPGMAVFSRYSKVIETDGTTMTVRSALARINEILDQVLNEQEGDFDNATRFAIAWYRQHGYVKGDFGSADNIARARNTSVETMVHEGILTSAAGKVELIAPVELPGEYDVLNDDRVGVWEVLHHLIARLDRGGLPEAGDFLAAVEARPDAPVDVELVKELAFLLFSIAEKNGWTQDALAFNTIATAWPDIVEAARSGTAVAGRQTSFDLEEG
jgi:putative DNA methylase